MIAYIINSVLCSTLLIAAYYLLLEKERAHRFKRWYLLGTLLLSLTIPLITIELERPQLNAPVVNLNEYFSPEIDGTDLQISESSEPVAEVEFNWLTILLIGYGIVTAVLLFRVLNNFLSILSDVRDKTLTHYREATVVLHNKYVIPYSFLNYIFISRQDFDNRQILMHELTHIRQRHSWDILFIELIHCLMWFNPAIIFYKKAIRLNHEFLADEVVIKNYPIAYYQSILFQKTQLTNALTLASSFNYSATKKRFIMMTTMKNQTRAYIKITLSLLLLACAAIIFPKKIYAQDAPTLQTDSVPKIISQQDVAGATAQMIAEYDTIIYKYVREDRSKTGKVTRWLNTTNVTDAERTRMREIYNVMTAEQKAKYPVHSHMIFIPFTPPKKNPPTAEEFASYADPKIYGIWLDGKRIANSELSKYKAADITHVFKSRLLKNAAHYGQYKFHLDLMTQEYFEKTYPPKFK